MTETTRSLQDIPPSAREVVARQLSRRRLLGVGAGLAAMAALPACRTEGAGTQGSGGGDASSFKPPNYQPPEEIPGASISDVEGVPPAYSQYPRDQVASVSDVPGKGGEVSTFQILFQAPPPQNNPWLKELDKRLGVTLDPTYAAGAAYGEKVQTLIASGDLPDIVFAERESAPAIVKPMQQGAFTDLTEVLAGSGIDKYPNLAKIPTYSWRNSSLDGKILGVPRPLPLINGTTMYRSDWAKDLGFTEPPKDAKEVAELLSAFTKGKHRGKKKGDTWGLAMIDHGMVWATQMFRTPNDWRLEDDGSLTNEIETDEYEAAVEWTAKLWKSGAFHPDAATMSALDAQSMYQSGKIGLLPAGITPHYRSLRPVLLSNDPQAEATAIAAPGWDGGKGTVGQENGYWGVAAIPAEVGKDKARLEELLAIINYWCAPFGSEEHTFINYGIEGRHFTYDDEGTPVAKEGDAPLVEAFGPSFLVQPLEATFFFPGDAEGAIEAQEFVAAALPESVENPVRSVTSEAAVRQNEALAQLETDYLYGMITGRRSLNEFKTWRKRWRSTGGDQIRDEYETALG